MIESLVSVLLFTTPLAIAAVGETVNQRAGQINIGLEGMMLVAAYVAAIVAIETGSPVLGIGAAIAAMIPLWLIQNFLTIQAGRDQVVVGTALNLCAIGLTSTLYQMRFGQSGQLLSVPQLPRWGGIDGMVVLGLILVPVLGWWLFRSRWGLVLRAAGEYPDSVRSSGISVSRIRWEAAAVGAVMAALAGAHLSIGVGGTFVQEMTSGRGFVAVALVSFGRWRPGWVLAACLLVGGAEFLKFYYQVRQTALPYQLFLALPYLVALGVLVIVGKNSRAPAALAQPFRSNQ